MTAARPSQRLLRHSPVYTCKVTTDELRIAWALVTRRPTASIREYAAELGWVGSKVWVALNTLHAAGYIEIRPGCRTRRVLVPFIVLAH